MFAASKSGRVVAAAATDPYFPYVPLLLETTSTNGQQNNTFLDSSTNNFTITRNGTPTQGSITPYWPDGYWSNYFVRASSQYLTVPNPASQFSFGTGALTIECWVYLSSLPSASGYPGSYWMFGGGPLNSNPGIDFYINATQIGFNLVDFTSPTAIGNHGMVVGAWYHVAVVRGGASNQTVSIYVNGTRVATATSVTATADAATTGIAISAAEPSGSTGGNFDGYISNYRVVKGTAVYDPTLTTLTVPTTPLTAIANTQLLTCQSNRFIDTNTQVAAKTITPNGPPRVQAFQPFSPTASYTTAAYGGSGYFNGSSDYLTGAAGAALAPGTGQFTIEMWIYFNSLASNPNEFFRTSNDSTAGRLVLYYASGSLQVVAAGGGGGTTASFTFVTGQWYHVAASRDASNNQRLFVNGILLATATSTNNYSQNGFNLGRGGSGTNYVNGYVSDCRLVNGTAVYTANFTPPTAPLTAITNTSLLLNFTNAGIYDAAVQNNTITVGDAQASTTQSKWSPTSMKFDGTGDWLTAIDGPQLNIGTGDFTIECWVNRTATASGAGNGDTIISKGTNNIILSINVNTSKFEFAQYGVAVLLTSTTVISNSTWYYVAITRSGTALRMFINGTQEASTTNSANFTSTTSMFVGADANNTNQRLNGYIQDLRITKGVARTITTPTAAFPTR
jgi:hypothetical protein